MIPKWSKNNVQPINTDILVVPRKENIIFIKILKKVLKKDMTHQIIMKEEENHHYLQEKQTSDWLDERRDIWYSNYRMSSNYT